MPGPMEAEANYNAEEASNLIFFKIRMCRRYADNCLNEQRTLVNIGSNAEIAFSI